MVMAGEERYKPCIILFADKSGQIPKDNVDAFVHNIDDLLSQVSKLWKKLAQKNIHQPGSH